jgi:DNA-binding MarR family transcriptional regulator
VQTFQEATDALDEAAATHLGLNRTDMRCLSVVARVSSVGASALAEATGLTRGAMTTALDRMEAGGYIRRIRDQRDRRAVRVELTGTARKAVDTLYGPLAADGSRLLRRYSVRDLKAVLRYLEEGVNVQRAHAQRIRRLAGRRSARSRT